MNDIHTTKLVHISEFQNSENSLLFNTLAQLVQDNKQKGVKNPLKTRAKIKYLSNELVLKLISENSDLNQSYWNSYHCSRVILQEGQKITSRYCNNRWCLVCNRIRTAKLINGYLPVIKSEIKNPQFVTLTVPNVSADHLRTTIEVMLYFFVLINRRFRLAKNGIKGIRKIEVTYNQITNEYHPHLHILVDGEIKAKYLIELWLQYYKKADKRGQNYKPADENSLIELFKYATKITVTKNKKIETPAFALDIIFQSLRNIRTYQPIGIKKLVPSEDVSELQSQEIENLKNAIDVWTWEHELKDWLNSNGEFLTEQKLTK